MKKLISIIAILLCITAALSGCGKPKTPLEAFEEAWEKTDTSHLDHLTSAYFQAQWNGDTYCKKCEKVNPGKVRICTYCGQYIS